MRQTPGLLWQEGAILSRIEDACEELLALVFENYYSLCEKAQSGILDGGVAAPDSPAPVLKPAVNLCRAPSACSRSGSICAGLAG